MNKQEWATSTNGELMHELVCKSNKISLNRLKDILYAIKDVHQTRKTLARARLIRAEWNEWKRLTEERKIEILDITDHADEWMNRYNTELANALRATVDDDEL